MPCARHGFECFLYRSTVLYPKLLEPYVFQNSDISPDFRKGIKHIYNIQLGLRSIQKSKLNFYGKMYKNPN